MTTEYFKITEWNRLLKTLKEDGVRVTRDEKEDIKIKIKLMQEAEEFGIQSQKQKIIEEIEKRINKKKLSENDVKLLVNSKYVKITDEWITIRELKELLKVIGEKDGN